MTVTVYDMTAGLHSRLEGCARGLAGRPVSRARSRQSCRSGPVTFSVTSGRLTGRLTEQQPKHACDEGSGAEEEERGGALHRLANQESNPAHDEAARSDGDKSAGERDPRDTYVHPVDDGLSARFIQGMTAKRIPAIAIQPPKPTTAGSSAPDTALMMSPSPTTD